MGRKIKDVCEKIRFSVELRSDQRVKILGRFDNSEVDCTTIRFKKANNLKTKGEYGLFCSAKMDRKINKMFRFQTNGEILDKVIQVNDFVQFFKLSQNKFSSSHLQNSI